MPKSLVPQPVHITAARFSGYPPALIAEWCGITFQQACRLKRGESKPSKGTLKLFELYRDERVLTTEFDGFICRKDKIVDPEGLAVTPQQLRGYGLLMQLMDELTRDNPAKRAEFRQILELRFG